jgi:hypothetical protein
LIELIPVEVIKGGGGDVGEYYLVFISIVYVEIVRCYSKQVVVPVQALDARVELYFIHHL